MGDTAEFMVWSADEDEATATTIYTYSPEKAAEEFAAQDGDGDYEDGAYVMVRDMKGTLYRFHIEVEYEPSFYARQVQAS